LASGLVAGIHGINGEKKMGPVQSIDWPAAAIVMTAVVTVALTFLRLYTGSANEKLKQIIGELKELNKLKSRVDIIETRQNDCRERREG